MPTEMWSFGATDRCVDASDVTSPSRISLIRAPETRAALRGDRGVSGLSSTIAVMSFGLRPKASATAATFSAIGARRSMRPRATGPTAIFRMYMSGNAGSVSGSTRGDHRHRAGAHRAPRPLRLRADRPRRCIASPPRPSRSIGGSGSSFSGCTDHDRCVGGQSVERTKHRLGRSVARASLVASPKPTTGDDRSLFGDGRIRLADAGSLAGSVVMLPYSPRRERVLPCSAHSGGGPPSALGVRQPVAEASGSVFIVAARGHRRPAVSHLPRE